MSIEILRPNAAGDITELYAYGVPLNWDAVNDEIPDDDITAVFPSASAVHKLDLYNLPSPSLVGAINSITVTIRCKKTASYNALRAMVALKTTGVVYYGLSCYLELYYLNFSSTYALNPNTGLKWSKSNIDALQIGVDLYSLGGGQQTMCTQVYVTIDYTPYEDIGLRIKTSVGNEVIACEPSGTLTSSLRIQKSGVTRGIVLVDLSDASASRARIMVGGVVKALAKL